MSDLRSLLSGWSIFERFQWVGLEQSRGLLSWRLWNEQQKTVLSLTFQNVRAFLSTWNSISIKEFWMTKLWLIANELKENQATGNILHSQKWWRYLYVHKNSNQIIKYQNGFQTSFAVRIRGLGLDISNVFQHFQLLSHSFIWGFFFV